MCCRVLQCVAVCIAVCVVAFVPLCFSVSHFVKLRGIGTLRVFGDGVCVATYVVVCCSMLQYDVA